MNFKMILVAVLAAVAGVSANSQQGHQSLGPGSKSNSANNDNDN